MHTYTDEPEPVNGQGSVEIEIPAFLPHRQLQAATVQPRRRMSPAAWSTVRARIAREHDALPEDSPRIKPTLPRLRLLSEPEEAA